MGATYEVMKNFYGVTERTGRVKEWTTVWQNGPKYFYVTELGVQTQDMWIQ